MNRVEFMAQLERLLIDLPENERQDALCYYNDYFDDAGEENEGKVIQELGSPGKVAAIIRASYRNGSPGEDQGEYTENGYRDTQFSEEGQMPAPHRNRNQNQQEERRSWWEEQREKRKEEKHFYSESAEFQKEDWRVQGHQRRGVGGWILLVVALIFLSPVILGIGGGMLGLFGGICAAVVALFCFGIGLVVGGIAGIVKGAFLTVTAPGAGLVTIGTGLLLLAIGLLLIVLFSCLLFKGVPKVVRAIVNFFSRVFHHGREKNEGGTWE